MYRRLVYYILLFIALCLFFFLDLAWGSVSLDFNVVLQTLTGTGGDELSRSLLFYFRLPKALTAVLVGMALSVSGLLMQTIFRNPLAGPYVLGISSGAGLGVAVVILGFSAGMGLSMMPAAGNWLLVLAAFTGGFLTMLLVLLVSFKIRDIMVILIFGIMFGSAASAIVSIMQYFSQESLLKTYVVWTMGSLGNLSTGQLQVLALMVGLGLLLAVLSIKRLNVFLLGEPYARSLGMSILPARLLVFVSTSILAGSVTAFCGPVGFIGIAIPHLARMIFRTSRHEVLIPATMLIGSLVLVLSDLISQLPGSDRILPINSVTALLGIPVILWFLFRGRKQSAYFYE